MKKLIFITFVVLFSITSIEVPAQNFFQQLTNSVKEEVKKKVTQEVNKGINKAIDGVLNAAKQVPAKAKNNQSQQQDRSELKDVKIIDAMIPSGPTSGELGGYQWVDMGLPSGTRWATCNVGATSPEQSGNHYSWGEITTKNSYTESNSKYYEVEMGDFSGNKDLDVATASWGEGWRMPTAEEFDELLYYCNWKYERLNGRLGARFTNPVTNSTIFLPVTGAKDGTSIDEPNGCGMYWTSTPKEDRNDCSYEYHFGSALGEMGFTGRFYGFAVRPVTDKDLNIDVLYSGETGGHKWVDLGLPSGLKWATCNIGAESADESGNFYSWGEIIPYTTNDSNKNDLYDKGMSDFSGNAQYDVARALWGGTWRTPTEADFYELIDNCTFNWTSINRLSGLKIVSNINGNYIFLPAAGGFYSGYAIYGYPDKRNQNAAYWTSTPSRYRDIESYAFNGWDSFCAIGLSHRFCGFSIRPVTE